MSKLGAKKSREFNAEMDVKLSSLANDLLELVVYELKERKLLTDTIAAYDRKMIASRAYEVIERGVERLK